jgi:two-component system CheB/CheR fusion protein
VVSKDVRDLCIFSPHSLIRDPPFSRIDLVSCRNLLIYFGPVVQNQVIPTFHYSLRPGGYLFLGMSENVSQFPDLFDPIDKKHRIFRSREDAVRRIRLPHNITDGHLSPSGTIRSSGNALGGVGALQHNFEAQILERHAPPHVVVNSEGEVVYFSSRTGRYLESPAGAPTRNLVSLAKKGLRLDISVAFREALEKNTSATRRGLVPEEETGDFLSVSITVEPVWSQNRDDRLYLVLFEAQGAVPGGNKVEGGTSQAQDAALRLEHEQRELKDRLQSTIEEYETALEELKSSNEELVSVNEELQSTNEELEASKEELQSMNEELHTVNNELSLKIDALDTANNDLRNLFESTQIATVFLDHRLTIRSFTPAIAGIFRILPTDRGRPISDLASGLDTSELRKNIEAVLAGGTAVESEIGDESTSSRYLVKINAYRSPGGRIDGVVVTFVDVTKLARAEAEQQILIDELHHRTRNLLTMVQSLIAQTMKNSRSMEEFQQKLEGRLSALSRVQGLLSSPASEVITVERLLKMELEAYEAKIESERVSLEGPAVVLSDELVKMLALALHELVTNAVKYGALHSPRGQLAVRWKVKKLNGSENLVLDWLETGIDLKADKQNRGTQGFGHYLIRKALPHQFGAVTVYEFLKDSLHCSIDVPLGEKRK